MLYSIGSVYFLGAYFGQGTGPIVLDNVLCYGTEPRIYDCASSNGVINAACSHARDASVRCLPSNTSMLIMCACSEPFSLANSLVHHCA